MHTTEQKQQQQQQQYLISAEMMTKMTALALLLLSFGALARDAPLPTTSCLRASFADSLEVMAKELAKEKGFVFDPIRSNNN